MVQNAIKIAPFTPWRDPYDFPKKKKKKKSLVLNHGLGR